MKNLSILLIIVSILSCKTENKYYPEHGFNGKVKKVTITQYVAIINYGSINTGEILFQSYYMFDENGKKIDGKTDFSNLKTDDFWEKTTSTESKNDQFGNWTETITYDENDNPYSITKRDFEYY